MEIARAGALLMASICASEGLSVHRCTLRSASLSNEMVFGRLV
jgi:hypothetical protein